MFSLLSDDKNDKPNHNTGMTMLSTICGRIIVGFVVRCRHSVNTICCCIMVWFVVVVVRQYTQSIIPPHILLTDRRQQRQP
jgi:hypothetical protein